MRLSELKERVSFIRSGHGHFTVTIEYRGNKYNATSTNTIVIDRINNQDVSEMSIANYGYTLKQAYISLYDEVKIKNNLY